MVRLLARLGRHLTLWEPNKWNESVFSYPFPYLIHMLILLIILVRDVVNFLFPGLWDCLDRFSTYREKFGNSWLQ